MQPQSSDHQFDFMLKDNQPAKKGFGTPKLSKPVAIGLGILLVIIILIVVSTILSSRKNAANKPMIDSVARAQEVLRVTKEVQDLGLQDPGTRAVAATVMATLTSDNKQLVQYLAINKIKITKAQLYVVIDRTVDSQMQSARQNNNLDQTYITYLQQYLQKYQNDLQIAYKSAPGPKGKDILKMAYDSETALLTNPPLKS